MTDKPKFFIEFADGRRVSSEEMPAYIAQHQAKVFNARFISLEESVGRCGITADQFKALVKEKVFPPRDRATKMWAVLWRKRHHPHRQGV